MLYLYEHLMSFYLYGSKPMRREVQDPGQLQMEAKISIVSIKIY